MEGTYDDLNQLAIDANGGKTYSHNGSAFGAFRHDLTSRKKNRKNKSERMIFDLYDASSTNVPRGCHRSEVIPSGPPAKANRRRRYKYWLYNDEFSLDADTLKLAACYKNAGDNDSAYASDSD